MSKDLSKVAEARLNEVVAYVRALNDSTQKVVLESIAKKLTDPVIRAQLAQVQSVAKATDAQIRKWLVEMLPKTYFDGFDAAGKKVNAKQVSFEALMGEKDYLFHRNAINLLLKESYADFGRMTAQTVRGAERILNDAARQQIRGQIAAGEIRGASVPQIARDIRGTLQDQGFKVMIDRAGRKWQLPDYSEMLARTHLIKTANEGVVNRLAELGYDIVEWSTADSPCDVCDPLDGQLFSISGNSDEYEQLKEQPPRHPNCRCALLPRPELGTSDE